MLAACYPTSGSDAGVISLREVDAITPGPGELRVVVAVSGVNPTDWKARKGGRAAVDAPLVTPDQDGAGTVESVGEGVDPGRVGERVWIWEAQWQRPGGTAAQMVTLPAHQAVPLPDGASFDLGASLGIPAMTAHRCLHGDGPLAPGEQVLVHGGAGAVGHAAIELARHAGARVAATVSSEAKARIASAAGAELVVNYRTEDVVEAVRDWAPDGVARIVEVDVNANLAADAELVASDGSIAVYAIPTGPVDLPWQLMRVNARLLGVLVYTMPPAAKAAAVEAITAALRDGALTTLPLHRFALQDTAAAHDAVEAGAVGKVLIDIP